MDKSWKLKIRNGIRLTREKRKVQICKVYELKVDESRLNKIQKETLKMLFIEAKWLYNYWLSTDKIFEQDCKNKEVIVLNKDKNKVKKQLKFLSCSYRQQILQHMKQSIYILAKQKKKGLKIGPLKFKKDFKCLELTKHALQKNGGTYLIVGKNRLKILGIKKSLIVNGLKNIPDGVEFANAKLIKKPSGYYIKVTTYSYPKIVDQKGEIENKEKKDVGIDFGIKNMITTSEGETFNCSIGETERLKRLQRKQSRQQKGSNNRRKTNVLLQKEYEKISNKKNDAANKIVHKLLTQYSRIYIQNDNFANWNKKLYNTGIQHSILGRIKAKLKESKQVGIIDQFIPTTKMCYKCGIINNEMTLNDRIFKCVNCDHEEDRDIKAAKTILMIGKINYTNVSVPTMNREFKPVEVSCILEKSSNQEDMKEISYYHRR